MSDDDEKQKKPNGTNDTDATDDDKEVTEAKPTRKSNILSARKVLDSLVPFTGNAAEFAKHVLTGTSKLTPGVGIFPTTAKPKAKPATAVAASSSSTAAKAVVEEESGESTEKKKKDEAAAAKEKEKKKTDKENETAKKKKENTDGWKKYFAGTKPVITVTKCGSLPIPAKLFPNTRAKKADDKKSEKVPEPKTRFPEDWDMPIYQTGKYDGYNLHVVSHWDVVRLFATEWDPELVRFEEFTWVRHTIPHCVPSLFSPQSFIGISVDQLYMLFSEGGYHQRSVAKHHWYYTALKPRVEEMMKSISASLFKADVKKKKNATAAETDEQPAATTTATASVAGPRKPSKTKKAATDQKKDVTAKDGDDDTTTDLTVDAETPTPASPVVVVDSSTKRRRNKRDRVIRDDDDDTAATTTATAANGVVEEEDGDKTPKRQKTTTAATEEEAEMPPSKSSTVVEEVVTPAVPSSDDPSNSKEDDGL